MAMHVRYNSWYISLPSSTKQREITKFGVVWIWILRFVPDSVSRSIRTKDWLRNKGRSVVKRNAILITNLWFIFKVTSKLKRFPIPRIRRKSFNSLEKINMWQKVDWRDETSALGCWSAAQTQPIPDPDQKQYSGVWWQQTKMLNNLQGHSLQFLQSQKNKSSWFRP